MQANRQQHLFRLWQNYLAETPLPQADRWLSFQFKINKQFGKKDRQFYANLFFAGLRHALFAVYCLDVTAQKVDLNTELMSWLSQYQDSQQLWQRIRSASSAVLFSWIGCRINHDSARQGDQLVYETYQKIAERLNTAELSAAIVWHSLPGAFVPHFEQRRTRSWNHAQLKQFCQAQDHKPPLWLRVKQKTQLQTVLTDLAQHRLTVLTSTALQQTHALAVAGEKGIYELACYKNGEIEIQDLASQMIGDAILCNTPKPMILDACAGGGGKTMQIAAALNNVGAIYAIDLRAYKLDEIKRRAKKGGFHNIRTLSWDWSQTALPEFPKEVANAKGFDWILVDAPCSSAGTWRRNPDAKWRFDINHLAELNRIQAIILRQAARLLKPGGCIAYATCSFLCAENEVVIDAFLAENPQYRLCSMRLLGAPEQDSDTMFVAVLQKLA